MRLLTQFKGYGYFGINDGHISDEVLQPMQCEDVERDRSSKASPCPA